MKRFLDFSVALTALAILWPLISIIAVLVMLKLGSPVFFRQVRPGLHGKPFTLLKFRSMRNSCDPHGNPLPDAERMTSFGALLRRLSLDELPQLINVLRGDMSLVGPRPLLMEYLPLYSLEQARRHEVRPGITGWAQVNGRNAVSWDEKFKLDLWYVDHHSFRVDAQILFMTVRRVFARDGIAAEGHVTMEKFRGDRQ